jgi:hypothetical protein
LCILVPFQSAALIIARAAARRPPAQSASHHPEYVRSSRSGSQRDAGIHCARQKIQPGLSYAGRQHPHRSAVD